VVNQNIRLNDHIIIDQKIAQKYIGEAGVLSFIKENRKAVVGYNYYYGMIRSDYQH
jgi:hypothetical protein